jgi:hypothetical protein
MPHLKIKLLSIGLILILLLPVISGCARDRDLDDGIRAAVDGFRFKLLDWEVKTLSDEAVKIITGHQTDDAAEQEKLIEERVRDAFSGQGIYNPLDRFITLKIGFPPVNIYIGKLPRILIVSPRDRIENIRDITLLPDITEEDMEAIEAEIEALGYSSVVEGLGGLSTFPSYITDDADISFIIDTTAHEWLHIYLAFTPLGFVKLLDTIGIRQDYDISTMNETVADIVGKEIGRTVYDKYYAQPEAANTPAEPAPGNFNFNKAMREIRLVVDSYLAKGEIDTAEKFMAEKRQYLEDNGYYIRKLNQAYFAFHGAYADGPTSVSPIGDELKKLRSQSSSLKEFLDRVAAMTSRRDLTESVK